MGYYQQAIVDTARSILVFVHALPILRREQF